MAESDSNASSDQASALQGYFDWQVTTLMLARDLSDPLDPRDPEAGEQRRRSIEAEVRTMTLAVIPDLLKSDPSLDWPPEVMMDITRTTLQHAAAIAGLV